MSRFLLTRGIFLAEDAMKPSQWVFRIASTFTGSIVVILLTPRTFEEYVLPYSSKLRWRSSTYRPSSIDSCPVSCPRRISTTTVFALVLQGIRCPKRSGETREIVRHADRVGRWIVRLSLRAVGRTLIHRLRDLRPIDDHVGRCCTVALSIRQ